MADFLRDCPPALALALQGNVELYSADLFQFTLSDGLTSYYWCSWHRDLTWDGQLYSSRAPWINRSGWSVTNDLTVPSMTVRLMALNDDFEGGGNIKLQLHNGLFDGATCTMSRVFMETPGDTSSIGAITLFGGVVAGIDVNGSLATIEVKGKNNLLNQNVPRNMAQIPCNHAFCDAGCTLNRAAFTSSYVVGTSPTAIFIPWSGSPPGNAANYRKGTLTMTSGGATGSRRSIIAADATGLTLSYPLWTEPLAGDTFTAFEGCTKMFDDGSGQDCTARSNQQHYRGFEFIPPPSSAY